MSIETLNKPNIKPNEMSATNNAFTRAMAEHSKRQAMYRTEMDRLIAAAEHHRQNEKIRKKQIPNDLAPFSNDIEPTDTGFFGTEMSPGVEFSLNGASQKESNQNENKGSGWTTEYFGGFGELSSSKEVGSDENGIGENNAETSSTSESSESGESGDSE